MNADNLQLGKVDVGRLKDAAKQRTDVLKEAKLCFNRGETVFQ